MLAILIVTLVALSLSFISSIAEASLYSIPISRAQTMADQNVVGGKLLLKLREHIDEPIAAVLTFNTVSATAGGAIVGALVAKQFPDNNNALLIFTTFFTTAVLVFSEIVPKTLGVIFADAIAPKIAFVLQALIYMLYPFVKASKWMTGKMRSASAEPKTVSKADIVAMARIGVEEGALIPEEESWIRNGFALRDKTAHAIMTPRTVVYRLPDELPMSMVTTHSEHWTHSRLPLCKNNDPDKVVGLVYRREVFDALLTKTDIELAAMKISELSHPVEFIPETLPGYEILERFLQGRTHLFIVTNEHGGMEGLITLEDVLEELLGKEIVDHKDEHEDMQEYARVLGERRRSGIQRVSPQ